MSAGLLLKKWHPRLVGAVENVGDFELEGLALETGRRVLDIGAQQGEFAAWALLKWPGVKVAYFEPQRQLFEMCVENLPVGTAGAMAAVTNSRERKGRLYPGLTSPGAASLLESKGTADTWVSCSQVWAGELPEVDLLKVSIGGGAPAVLWAYGHLETCMGVAVECGVEEAEAINEICEARGLTREAVLFREASQILKFRGGQ